MRLQELVDEGILDHLKQIPAARTHFEIAEINAYRDVREDHHLALTSLPRTDTADVERYAARVSDSPEDDRTRLEWIDQRPVTEYLDIQTWTDKIGCVHEDRVLMQIGRTENYLNPDNQSFVDMGTKSKENPALDHRRMDNTDFRERCAKVGNRLQVIYKRAKVDFEPPLHHRPEVLADVIGCSTEDGATICGIIKKLELSKSMAQRLIYGYVTEAGERKTGLKGIGERAEHFAEVLESYVSQLPELGPMVEDEDGSPLAIISVDNANSIRFDSDGQVLTDSAQDMDEDRELDWMVDDFGEEISAPVTSEFHTYPLHGPDQLKGDTLVDIATCSPSKLTWYRRAPFKAKNPLRLYGKGQSDFWKAVNQREKEILAQAATTMTQKDKSVLSILKACRYKGQAKALLLSYQNGRSYNHMGSELTFDACPDEYSNYALWYVFRNMKFQTPKAERKVA